MTVTTMQTDPTRIAAIRAFTRFYTAILRVLEERLLDSPYSMTQARVIFELAQRPATDVADLRRDLGVDAGYMTRIIERLETDEVLSRERSTADARRQVLRLTEQGRAVFATLDERSAAQVADLLAGVPDADQRRLVAAMDTIQAVLGATPSRPR